MAGYPIIRTLKHATLNAFKAMFIPVDSTYFDNTGSLITPKTVITQQGNSFNAADKLMQFDSNGKYPAADGSAITNITATNLAPAVPYSVISAKVDANGDPSFMTSAMTQLNFDVSVPIKICYPNGVVESNATMASITTGLSNGTNYIIKEFGSNPYFTLLKPVESKTAPSSPSTGQLWLDISVKPYIGKKWNGSAWIVTQYVKLGEVLITTLVIGTPTCYTFGDTYYGEKTQPYTSGSFACNMGTVNHSVSKIGLLCLNTVAGVGTAGKFYPVVARASGGDAFSVPGYKQSANSIDYITANVGWYINGDGGDQVAVSGTNANFKMVVVAKRDF